MDVARISTYLTPAVTFGVFIAVAQRSGGSLSVSKAFTSLSLLSLLSSPLSLMFNAVPQTSMALACFSRIQDFLVEDDKDVGGITNGMSRVLMQMTDLKLEKQVRCLTQKDRPLNLSC